MSPLKTDLDACNKGSVQFSQNYLEFRLIFIRHQADFKQHCPIY